MTKRFRELAGTGLVASLAGLALLHALGVWKVANAAEDKLKAYGRHLARECTGCHRLDGVDNGIPSIVGWQADVFVATVKFYRKGARTNPVMVSVAGSLNDKQLNALATYFASLPKPPPASATDRKPGR